MNARATPASMDSALKESATTGAAAGLAGEESIAMSVSGIFFLFQVAKTVNRDPLYLSEQQLKILKSQ